MRVAAAVVLCAGCSFDRAGLPLDDGGVSDIDAAICEVTTAAITVDGVPHASDTTPAATVLVGDTVILSSQGSCGPTALTYEWDVSPINGTRDTLRPGDTAAAVSVYATEPDAYLVTLTVRAGDANASTTIFAFDARGFAELAATPDKVRDLDAGGGQLWIASEQSTFRADLDSPVTLVSVDAELEAAGQEPLPAKTDSILWDDARTAVWVGGFDPGAAIWRIDYDGGAPAIAELDYATLLGGTARAADLALVSEDQPGTLAAATELGVAFSSAGTAFDGSFAGPAAAAAEATGTWVLADLLRGVDDGREHAVLGGTPRALAPDLDGGGLWVASEGDGVAHVRFAGSDLDVATFDDQSGLPSNNGRAIAIERGGRFAGDVWVATDKGLARWKADRSEWVIYGNPQGLMGYLDLDAVAVSAADGEPRQVFAGGAAGLVYAALP